jgi:hypothetical protein
MSKDEEKREITIDDLYRLRASSNITNIEYGRTGRKDAPFYLFKKGLPATPVALVGTEDMAKYFVKINDIVDLAIKLSLENTKLVKEVSRNRRDISL